ncbi:hypothetical protein [Terrihalobacillus insolitus]|uniref:hypothetical protein n=1 Tax=Terrihalobacillus insolitus TaxID=2950438 RepID=UPI00233F9681|nr:hypothetical protein [Terrihalobacillus insolitus]MDC3414820.1 hypothetical protein [Terrihalobacillus insolitus]
MSAESKPTQNLQKAKWFKLLVPFFEQMEKEKITMVNVEKDELKEFLTPGDVLYHFPTEDSLFKHVKEL